MDQRTTMPMASDLPPEERLKLRILDLEAANGELVEREAEHTRSLGLAAHDLRGPIGSIHGLAGLMMERGLQPERQRAMAAEILRMSGEVLDVLDKLDDIARIDGHKLDLRVAPVDLAGVIAERIDRVRAAAEAKNILIVSQYESLPAVPGDRERLGQVVDNLLDNALKFSPPGSRIWIDLFRLGVAAIISVTDQGQGIPDAELHRLFGTFSRLSNKPTGGETGNGLGLSIVRRIVEGHDGVVGVESRVGRGSSFRVILPFAPTGTA